GFGQPAVWLEVCRVTLGLSMSFTALDFGDFELHWPNYMAATVQSVTRLAHPTIQRFFEVSLYLLLFTGFAMLAGTSKLDAFSLVLGLCALLVKGYLLVRRNDAAVPEQWTTYLTLAYVIFFALDYFLISQTFLDALV